MTTSTDAQPAGTTAPGPRHNRDFLKLWSGQAVSDFGTQITLLAFPLIAVSSLDATSLQMGFLNAAGHVPIVVLTLLAGAWVDRVRRRPVMIATNVARAVTIAAVPCLAFAGVLRMEYLYAITLVLGSLGVLFDVCYQAYLPTIVPPEQLVAANGRLQATYSAARVGGPGVGGLLVQALSAPVALLVDALSFLVSAVGLSSIEAEERVRSKEERAGRVWTSITEGLRYSFGQPLLRAVTIQATCWNLFIASIQAVYIMYATRQLGLSPALIGLTSAGGAVGSLIASFTTRRMALRFGTGRTIAGAVVLGCSAPLLLPLAGGPTALVIAVIALSFFLSGVGATTSNVHVVALRQTITPQDLIGRATASHRFCAGSALPLGALLGGVMGEVLGLREALFVSAAALFCTPVLILTSPIPGLRELPKGPMK